MEVEQYDGIVKGLKLGPDGKLWCPFSVLNFTVPERHTYRISWEATARRKSYLFKYEDPVTNAIIARADASQQRLPRRKPLSFYGRLGRKLSNCIIAPRTTEESFYQHALARARYVTYAKDLEVKF